MRGSVLLLGIFGGWLFLSCIAAPLIGRFLAVPADLEDMERKTGEPVQSAALTVV